MKKLPGKKTFTAVMAVFLAIVLTGCSKTQPSSGNSNPGSLAAGVTQDENDLSEGFSMAGKTGSGQADVAGNNSAENDDADVSNAADGRPYRLKEPEFIDTGSITLCKVAQDYINLSDDEFDMKYTDDELWELGAYDRLLFTERTKGSIIAGIGIGSTLQQVLDTFGKSQFGTEAAASDLSSDYNRYLLCGYKTRHYYFAFQIDPDTNLVKTICFRKRYELPDDKKDMLTVLAGYNDWYTEGNMEKLIYEWGEYFGNNMAYFAQLSRGTMTLISDYGFTSTSGIDLKYYVYSDYSGDIPVIPPGRSEFSGKDYDVLTILDVDYPQWRIYKIYNYLAERDDAIKNGKGVFSPDGSLFAYAVDADQLDMRSSGLYEHAHVIFHDMRGEHPDKHIYFGHYSTPVGFIGDRYFVESNMMGLHVLNVKNWDMVYSEDDMDGGNDLRIDEKSRQIVDQDGNVRYRYELTADGDLNIYKVNR